MRMGQCSANRKGVWGSRLAQTLDKVDALEKQFAGADGSERKAFGRGAKVDPQVRDRHDATGLWTLPARFTCQQTVPSILAESGDVSAHNNKQEMLSQIKVRKMRCIPDNVGTPQVVLGLAEQRVEKLLAKFAADRTVSVMRCCGDEANVIGCPRCACRASWLYIQTRSDTATASLCIPYKRLSSHGGLTYGSTLSAAAKTAC